MKKNRHGLSRNIPAEVKRTIRQRSGFGCVICGFAICHYEHVDPEFLDAREHNADCMTLLCGRCNDKKRRGILSKEAVKRAMLNPKCLQEGFTFDTFDVGTSLPTIQFSDSTWTANKAFVLLRINGTDLVRFEPPEEEGSPFLLSAQFYNYKGKRIFWIERNEWFGDSSNWDIETIGQVITIRRAAREYELEIRNIPNERLIINKVNMLYKGYKIKGNDREGITILTPNGKELLAKNTNATGSGAEVTAFEVNGDEIIVGKATGGPSSISVSVGYLGPREPQQLPIPVRPRKKVPRNAPCPCNSGRKYKHCCGR
jgi:hypothetical protein